MTARPVYRVRQFAASCDPMAFEDALNQAFEEEYLFAFKIHTLNFVYLVWQLHPALRGMPMDIDIAAAASQGPL